MAAAVKSKEQERSPDESKSARRRGLYCALAGLLTATIFTFVIYPRIALTAGAVLDPDGYGALGWGLWKLHTFSYFPSHRLSVGRGPLYPLMVAALLQVSGGWWPYCVQAAQCVLFGVTSFLTFEIARRLWNIRAGTIAGLACALHPFVVWYTSRIWIEALTVPLFTAIMAATLYFQERPNALRAALLGLALGAACLCKGTFLPFLAAVPALLWIVKPRVASVPSILSTGLVAVLVILPWTARNWMLTRTVIPVHGMLGFNLLIGDYLVAHFTESPWAVTPLWAGATTEASTLAQAALSEGYDGWQAEKNVDSILLRASFRHYMADPLFLLRKILLGTMTFWTWSDTKLKTIVVSSLQLPLLLTFLGSVWAIARRNELRTIRGVPAALVLLYYGSHLPLLAAARYSVVVVPTMIAYSVGTLLEQWKSIGGQSPW
jgi:4-amino-4-deoxy-L-arabinose transferase-like glycosyltransferase